jgi:hypothetical protein
MLEKQYADTTIRETQQRLTDGTLVDFKPERPLVTPENIWDQLTDEQRVMQWTRRWAGRVTRSKTGLTDEDMLRILNDGISADDARGIVLLWNASKCNDSNPTRAQLINRVMESSERGETLEFCLSQCIDKKPESRMAKLRYLLRGERVPVRSFITGLDKKGWSPFREALAAFPDRSTGMLYLGDMDWFGLDCCDRWIDEEGLSIFRQEITEVQYKTQKEANEFFGEGKVAVRLWSEDYSLDLVRQEYERARTNESWRTDDFMKTSRYPYMNQWGYPALAKELDVNREQLRSFIDDDIIRTAAQYRVEANVLRAKNGIQCWAETVGSLQWPLEISNYDRNGLPPTLILA